MSSGIVIILIVGVLVLIVAGSGIGIYNRLVTLRERFKNGLSQIEIQLKRRYDLIPNLVETAKAYLKHERETLEAITAARNQALAGLEKVQKTPGPSEVREFARAEMALGQAMTRFMAVVESYPELKANQVMSDLTEELTSTENKIAFARQAYNDAVTEFNSYRRQFPALLIAQSAGFSEDAALLEFADSAQLQVAPRVSFSAS